jgi:hypothetical protein
MNDDQEFFEGLDTAYENLIVLEDIRRDLRNGKSITQILHPPFDPFKTIGKY